MEIPHDLFRRGRRKRSPLTILAASVTLAFPVLAGGCLSQNPDAGQGVAVNGANPKSDLELGNAVLVEGTPIMRAYLQRPGTRFGSSSELYETRNVLFIEAGQGAAHWLLSDNDHDVQVTDIETTHQPNVSQVIASAALVKPAGQNTESAMGKLLLFDPPGRRIVEVSDGVAAIQIASISGDEISILFERGRRLALDVFDAQSLTKLRERVIEIPPVR
jgi:hypothetical protein